MVEIFSLKKHATARIWCHFFMAVLAATLFFWTQPIACTAAPAAAGADYEIPLSELKRVVKKKPAKKAPERTVKAKNDLPKKVSKRRTPPADSALWATLASVRMIDEGVRLDIDDLTEKFKLVLEPHNKKVILQFGDLQYQSRDVHVPLGTYGFVQARIGRHTDGTWIVLDTVDSVLPVFEVRQDSDGITLKTSSIDQTDESDQAVLLTKEAVKSARLHVLTPEIFVDEPDDAQPEQSGPEPSPLSANSAETPVVPSDETGSVTISHIPFSFVVAEKQTLIQAVISSKNEVKDVHCVVQTTDEGKPTVIPMTKTADTLYTYEGKLPEQPSGSQSLRYRIVTRDSLDKETKSKEFVTPVTPSSVVPGWQQ